MQRVLRSAEVHAQFVAIDRLERAIESIQGSIETQGGALVVKMKASHASHQCPSLTFCRSRKQFRKQKNKIWHNLWPRLDRRMQRCRVTKMTRRGFSSVFSRDTHCSSVRASDTRFAQPAGQY